MTTGLAVSAGTMTRLKTIAAEEGATPQDLAEKAIRRFLRFETRRKIQREDNAFCAMHAELRGRYPDQYVAVYRGKVVDHDPDQLALFRRVEERYPDVPVLIRQVSPEHEEVYTFRSPRVNELRRRCTPIPTAGATEPEDGFPWASLLDPYYILISPLWWYPSPRNGIPLTSGLP